MTFNLNTSPKNNKFNHNSEITSFKKTAIASAIALSLSFSTSAVEFNVAGPTDDGTGLVANTLSWAILQANTTPGDDVITLNTDVTITGVMKRLIDSNTTLHSDSIRRTINGTNSFRPLFIKSGNVLIEDIDMVNGMAQGGGLGLGGDGANMGGSIFIYDGNITIKSVRISNSTATTNAIFNNGYGGGGIFGNTYGYGGGGLFASTSNDLGGYGGYGNYRTNDSKFGEGGSRILPNTDLSGGFGGGGAFSSNNLGNGGFGGFGGGGGSSDNSDGGAGGFGAGGGATSDTQKSFGDAGYGGYGWYAASMGGSIFIRTGNVNLSNIDIHNSQAIAFGKAKGLGGAMFIMHTTSNSNGNNQGMPSSLPMVIGCGISFNGNISSSDTNTSNNNDNIFDLGNNFNNHNNCEQEIEITENNQIIIDGSTNLNINGGTDFGIIFINTTANVKTYTISNLGGMDLNLTDNPVVNISGDDASNFFVSSQPVNQTLSNSLSTSFEVMFSPTSIGLKTAIITVENNDSDESTYDFAIQGTGKGPEINIVGNSLTIDDGDLTPNLNDFTDFGFNQQSRLFTVENSGVADLTLTGMPNITITGADAGEFTVTIQPGNNVINASSSVDFEIEFTPSSNGLKTATVNIENDDADEGMYSFTIQGGEPQEPEIEIESLGMVLLDGSNFSPNLWSSVPAPQVGSFSSSIAFTVKNTGPVPLQISNLYDDGPHDFEFMFTQPVSGLIQPHSSSDFIMYFRPFDSGLRTTTVHLLSNDTDESDYEINLFGTGIPTVYLIPGNPVDIQEGGTLNFTASLDFAAISNIVVNYSITGDVEAVDFDNNSLTGQVTINTGEFGADINLATTLDGITEGPELVVLGIQSSSPDVFMGTSLAIGQVDDTLIFENGFESIMPTLFAEIFTSTNTENQKLIYDGINHSFVYFDSEYKLDPDFIGFDYTLVYQWLEDTLILNKPDADWDEDSIINKYDDEPYGK